MGNDGSAERQAVVLVVDDEPFVLNAVCEMLVYCGFAVLQAASAETALSLGRMRHQPIHLLLCDVLLPRMTGPDLAEQFLLAHPETRCLFMAGLPDTREIAEKILDRGLPFLPKPFLPATLAEKVRQVLGENSRVMRAAAAAG